MGQQHSRKSQIDLLRPKPSELPGSLFGLNFYPSTTFLLGMAVGSFIWIIALLIMLPIATCQ